MGGKAWMGRAALAGALLLGASLFAACDSDIESASAAPAADYVTSGFTGVQRGLQVVQAGLATYQAGDTAQGLAQLRAGRQLISGGLGTIASGLGMTDRSGTVDQCRGGIMTPLQTMQTGLEELDVGLALLEAGGDATQGLTHAQSAAAIVDRGRGDMDGALMGCGMTAGPMGGGGR